MADRGKSLFQLWPNRRARWRAGWLGLVGVVFTLVALWIQNRSPLDSSTCTTHGLLLLSRRGGVRRWNKHPRSAMSVRAMRAGRQDPVTCRDAGQIAACLHLLVLLLLPLLPLLPSPAHSVPSATAAGTDVSTAPTGTTAGKRSTCSPPSGGPPAPGGVATVSKYQRFQQH